MDYFDEKAEQISVNTMTAFGIRIDSMFYDSKSDTCSFVFVGNPAEERVSKIRAYARQHISQFEWDGEIERGKPFPEHE